MNKRCQNIFELEQNQKEITLKLEKEKEEYILHHIARLTAIGRSVYSKVRGHEFDRRFNPAGSMSYKFYWISAAKIDIKEFREDELILRLYSSSSSDGKHYGLTNFPIKMLELDDRSFAKMIREDVNMNKKRLRGLEIDRAEEEIADHYKEIARLKQIVKKAEKLNEKKEKTHECSSKIY